MITNQDKLILAEFDKNIDLNTKVDRAICQGSNDDGYAGSI